MLDFFCDLLKRRAKAADPEPARPRAAFLKCNWDGSFTYVPDFDALPRVPALSRDELRADTAMGRLTEANLAEGHTTDVDPVRARAGGITVTRKEVADFLAEPVALVEGITTRHVTAFDKASGKYKLEEKKARDHVATNRMLYSENRAARHLLREKLIARVTAECSAELAPVLLALIDKAYPEHDDV
jgi:hypothetical protein